MKWSHLARPFLIFHCFFTTNTLVAAIDKPTSSTVTSPSPATSNKGGVHNHHGSGATLSPFAQDFGDGMKNFGDDVEEFIDHYSAFAGKIFPILSKLYVPPSKAKQILKEIKNVANLGEWIMIIAIGWVTVPFLSFVASKGSRNGKIKNQIEITERDRNNGKNDNSNNNSGNNTNHMVPFPEIPFEETFIFQLAKHIAGAGKIAALVYCIDSIIIALVTLGFDINTDHSNYIAKGIYSTWVISRVLGWKRYIVTKAVYAIRKGNPEGKKNRALIYNKVTDFIVVLSGISFLLDVLKVKTGVTLTSFFAMGGAGTVLISFASKDLVMAWVSGLALQASDKMFEGDIIKFNNIQGQVNHIGLMETIITDDDEMIMAIPNKDLASSQLINLSKIKMSRFKQDLRFFYDDSQKLPVVLSEIKKEITKACPLVVTDGTKPLRAYLKNMAESYLEVEVEVKMRCRPGCEDYKKGKQDVLLAIDRAVRKCNVKFAVDESVFVNA